MWVLKGGGFGEFHRHTQKWEQQAAEGPRPRKLDSLSTIIKRSVQKEYEQSQKGRLGAAGKCPRFPDPEGSTCGPGSGGSLCGSEGPQLQLDH